MEEKGNQNQMLSSRLEQVTLRREVPEHLDQGVWEGVKVDVELALCWMLVNPGRGVLYQMEEYSRSTSFLV